MVKGGGGVQNRHKNQCQRECKVAVQRKSCRAAQKSPFQVSVTPNQRPVIKKTCICIRVTLHKGNYVKTDGSFFSRVGSR